MQWLRRDRVQQNPVHAVSKGEVLRGVCNDAARERTVQSEVRMIQKLFFTVVQQRLLVSRSP